MKLILLMGIVLVLSACGESTRIGGGGGGGSAAPSGSDENKKVTMAYCYNVNGCSTGRQTFSSKEAYCSGLQDQELNKSCATDVRMKIATKECGEVQKIDDYEVESDYEDDCSNSSNESL